MKATREQACVSYIVAPGFPGGTSSAVAAELATVAQIARPRLSLLTSKMFPKAEIAPQLDEMISRNRFETVWNPRVIQDDVVILHNPSFLKWENHLENRIVARHLVVVTHENFARPGGAPPFDVESTLTAIDRASIAERKSLAPVGPYNRRGVEAWMAQADGFNRWDVLADDWFNILNSEFQPPSKAPRDRRGRLSRPGAEKFPSIEVLEETFPASADSNVLLGADHLLASPHRRRHWSVIPFRGLTVDAFFEKIDFLVYFTQPTLRESFGRVLAEGIAAGKVVISDAETGAPFDGGVVMAETSEVSALIQSFVSDPQSYVDQVNKAQDILAAYRPEMFLSRFGDLITNPGPAS